MALGKAVCECDYGLVTRGQCAYLQLLLVCLSALLCAQVEGLGRCQGRWTWR